ncbi:hypothetical protein HGR_14374 [Hylemonella gracilis ATCC 19624]|uniref:Uncharacterized protein n=1 Tax=Hylemonella gracilis ATCC 19624 TaxID=887062 RepID=F3KWN6_9BURK|nr:hypothetical protein HGR_14374 [Hylemonella gracilis ATCC 19624]
MPDAYGVDADGDEFASCHRFSIMQAYRSATKLEIASQRPRGLWADGGLGKSQIA